MSGEVKQCFFLLFLFSIGFRTGPQFFRGLRSDGLQQAALSAIVATTGLVVAYVVSRLFSYDAGTAAGVIAGALTESATIGTASDAIGRLGLSPADARRDDQPDSGRLRRDLSDRRRRRRLVPGAARAAASWASTSRRNAGATNRRWAAGS